MSTARSRARRKRAGLNAIVARMKRDDGFTLIELLIGTVILGIIIGAIAQALIVGFTTTGETSQRFAESHDAQIASAWLAKDVQGAVTITTPSCPLGNVNLIGFSSNDKASGLFASYCYGQASNGETRVTRHSTTDTLVLAHFATQAGAPIVTCDSSPSCPTGSQPQKVQITVTEATGYSYSILGARRTYTAPGAVPPTPAEVGFLGVGLTGVGLIVSKAGVVANSGFYVNSSNPGAVTVSGCNKPENQVKPFCLTVTPTTGFKIYQYTPASCNGCDASNVSPYPPGNLSQRIPDPLQYLAYPDEVGLPRFSDGTYHGPGVYTTLLNINHDQTMAPGIYILEKGITLQKQQFTTTTIQGSGVMLFNGCGLHAPVGCTSNGQVNIQGGTTVDLSPPTCGAYQGILIFQARDNPQTIKIGGTSAVSSFNGIIYAYAAGVDWSGASDFRVDSVISGGTMSVTGGSLVTITPSSQVPQPC
jgi:prepilin-type N-terminal cleavage/methylation domain-containing protein